MKAAQIGMTGESRISQRDGNLSEKEHYDILVIGSGEAGKYLGEEDGRMEALDSLAGITLLKPQKIA